MRDKKKPSVQNRIKYFFQDEGEQQNRIEEQQELQDLEELLDHDGPWEEDDDLS